MAPGAGHARAAAGLFVNGLQQGQDEVSFYPNPVKDNLTIKFPNAGNHQVRVYNIFGKMIINYMSSNENLISLNMDAQPSGVYFIKYVVNGKEVTKRFSKQ